MKTKIFITPWIDVENSEIDEMIAAGANSARIHTGKCDLEKVNSLIEYYTEKEFKFYLDMNGNKSRTQNAPHVELGDIVIFREISNTSPEKAGFKYIYMDFFPEALNRKMVGDLTVDDGKTVFNITNYIENEVYTEVVKLGVANVCIKDGISSNNIPITSFAKTPFSAKDIQILDGIPENLRKNVKFVVVSFCENIDQLRFANDVLKEKGYVAQLVPKVETLIGIKNLKLISNWLTDHYGTIAEIHLGRGDLSSDCERVVGGKSIEELTLKAISDCKKYGVKLSVLALILKTVKFTLRANPELDYVSPSDAELVNIEKWVNSGVYQIGITDETYIDNPKRIVKVLANTISNCSK